MKVAQFAQRLGRGVDIAAEGDSFVDFTQSQGSLRFDSVRRRTQCVFAAKAILWGNDWVDSFADEDALAANVALSLPRFYRFCLEVRAGRALDGFVFEARGAQYGSDLESFARTVRRVLSGISSADPAGVDCMKKSNVDRRGWYFQFARESFFVTTFAPCYNGSNARYQFDVAPESCFVLLQPEESFYRHDLPPDKPRQATNWDKPVDVRDRIRANFKRHGREYRIPETTSYPPAHFIVASLKPLEDPIVSFWRDPETTRALNEAPQETLSEARRRHYHRSDNA